MVFQDVNTQLFTEKLEQELQLLNIQVVEAKVDNMLESMNLLAKKYEHLIQQAIDELSKGKTVITIAHKIGTIKNANEIIVLNEGQIIQIGNHHTLLQTSGMYKDFITIKNQSEGW